VSAPPLPFARLKKNLKRDSSAFPQVRLAILGDSPTQLLHQALRGYGIEVRIDYAIFEADYDQIDRQILDPTSDLYASRPEIVLVFESTRKLHEAFARGDAVARSRFADDHLARTRHRVSQIGARHPCQVIWCNYPETGEDVFGSFAGKTEASFTYQIRKLNLALMDLVREQKGLFLCDLAALQSAAGQGHTFSPATYVNTGIVFELETWAAFAERVTAIVLALRGAIKKCLVLDLDNTLWGGVIGDDGLEGIQIGDLGLGRAFTEVQLWAKLLQDRGVLLAICSKNDEAIAKEPFERHPDMVLRLADVAMFVANWENKVDNLRHIQAALNLGMDSLVFVDDNPFERGMVRSAIPELCVPELPEDPAEYAPYLQSLNLFETASFSAADGERTRQYQEEAARATFQRSFASEAEYLESLGMVSVVSPFDDFNSPRVAQLTQRSNQWNLRTVRYTERDIAELRGDRDAISLSFTLSDRFGDHGLVSVVLLRRTAPDTAFIDTWLMSCRVLKRGMEGFVLNGIVAAARAGGLARVEGEYLPTAKNGMVADHYPRFGFQPRGSRWELLVDTFEPLPTWIRSHP
jgi:FkbH-like protein